MSHLVLVVVIIAQSLAVLVQLAHQHLPRAEIEGAEVHLVTKVTGQLRLAPKLLPRWTGGVGRHEKPRYCYHLSQEQRKKGQNERHSD